MPEKSAEHESRESGRVKQRDRDAEPQQGSEGLFQPWLEGTAQSLFLGETRLISGVNAALSQAMALQMQVTVGNRAVQRMLGEAQTGPGQSLGLGARPAIQRQTAGAQATGGNRDLARDIRTRQGNGHRLPDDVRLGLETVLEADLSGVLVHTDGEADRLARSVEAVAFTSGQDIFFRAGAYDPSSTEGLRVLAHEAAHTAQQASGPVAGASTSGGVSISDPADSFEQAADEAAGRAMRGAPALAQRVLASPQTSGQVQTVPEEEEVEQPVQTMRASAPTLVIQRQTAPEAEEEEEREEEEEEEEKEGEPVQRMAAPTDTTPGLHSSLVQREPSSLQVVQRKDGEGDKSAAKGKGKGTTVFKPVAKKSYTVDAKTLEEASEHIETREEAGLTEWNPTYKVTLDEDGNVESATVDVPITVEMPNWPGAAKLSKAAKAEWNRFYKALDAHEQGHVKLVREKLKGLAERMVGKSEAEAGEIFTEAVNKLNEASKAYDAGNDHGRKEGTVLDTSKDTSPVQPSLQRVASATAPSTGVYPARGFEVSAAEDRGLYMSVQRQAALVSVQPYLQPLAQPTLQRQETPAAKPPESAGAPTVKSTDLPEDAAKQWGEKGGDTLIADVQADLSQWQDYRKNPTSMENMPGKNASSAIKKFLDTNQAIEPWMKQFANSKLGAANLAYLKEMASMDPTFATDVGLIFNVAKTNPGHEFSCKTHDAVGLQEGAVQSVAPALDISYTNSFGWKWSRKFTTPGFQFYFGFEKEPEIPADVEIDPSKPNVIQPKFDPGIGVKAGEGPPIGEVELLQIDLKGEAKAKPLQFYGMNDLEGAMDVVGGPSGEVQVSIAGGELSSGMAIRFYTQRSVPLVFEQFKLDSKIGWTGKMKPKVKFSLATFGLGYAFGGKGSVEQLPEYEPQVVKDSRQWTMTVFYKTGDWVPPDSVVDQLVAFGKQAKNTMAQLKIEEDKDLLKQKGIELAKAMELDITIIGRASRAWKSAPTEAARVEENEELAVKRAVTLRPMVETLFAAHPGNVVIAAIGGGPGTMGKSFDGEAAPFLKESSAEETYKWEKEKVNKAWDEQAKMAKEESGPAKRKERLAEIEESRKEELKIVEHLYGPQSDVTQARRVDVTVSWNGWRVAHELPGVPKGGPSAGATPQGT